MAIYLGDLELATGAAAATGTGLPVNSYAPFYKSVSGNPTGWFAAVPSQVKSSRMHRKS